MINKRKKRSPQAANEREMPPVGRIPGRIIHDGLDKGPFHRDCFYVTGILSSFKISLFEPGIVFFYEELIYTGSNRS
jgi:hypothetical protein